MDTNEAIFSCHILTGHSRKGSGVTNNVNGGYMTFNYGSKPQWNLDLAHWNLPLKHAIINTISYT